MSLQVGVGFTAAVHCAIVQLLFNILHAIRTVYLKIVYASFRMVRDGMLKMPRWYCSFF